MDLCRIVTRNSVYTLRFDRELLTFHVRRTADMWGRAVVDTHDHVTAGFDLAVGKPFVTSSGICTTPVEAILPVRS